VVNLRSALQAGISAFDHVLSNIVVGDVVMEQGEHLYCLRRGAAFGRLYRIPKQGEHLWFESSKMEICKGLVKPGNFGLRI